MSEDTELEARLRKALSGVNELEPPPDDLFVDRAVSRGRAKAHQTHRGWLVAAGAAGVLAVGGGGWWLSTHGGGGSMPSSAAGAWSSPADSAVREAVTGLAADAPNGGGSAPSTSAPVSPTTGTPEAPTTPVAVPTGEQFFTPFDGPPSARQSIDPALEYLLSEQRDSFVGAWVGDGGIVLAFTRADPSAQEQVRALAAPGTQLTFTTGRFSVAEQGALMQRVASDVATWASKGVSIQSIANDPRTGQLVLSGTPAAAQADLDARYGTGTTRWK